MRFRAGHVLRMPTVRAKSREGRQRRWGVRSSLWQGGVGRHNRGYIRVYQGPEQERGFEHRLMAERMLGRRLRRSEVVHHRNGVRADNRPENLEILTRSQHIAFHHALRTAEIDTKIETLIAFFPDRLTEQAWGALRVFALQRADRWSLTRRQKAFLDRMFSSVTAG